MHNTFVDLKTRTLKLMWSAQDALRNASVAMFIPERQPGKGGLSEGEETFNAIAATAPDAILMLNADEDTVFWNAAAEQLFGYPSEEGLGNNLYTLLTSMHLYATNQAKRRHFEVRSEDAPMSDTIELVALKKDRTTFPMRFSLSAVRLGYKVYTFGVVRDISKNKPSELALVGANRAQRALRACNRALLTSAQEPELLGLVCQLLVNVCGYRMALVGFADQNLDKTVRVAASYGVDKGRLKELDSTWADTERGRGPTGTAMRTWKTQVNQGFFSNSRITRWRDHVLAWGFEPCIAIPLTGRSGILGALTLYANGTDAFDRDEVQHLQELAENLALRITALRIQAVRDHLANTYLRQASLLKKRLRLSVSTDADTVELREGSAMGHQKRVARLAVAIASDMGLRNREIENIHLAASIHDLGKLQVPAAILSKPDRLNDKEFALVKQHPQNGHRALQLMGYPEPIANIVYQHHERLDGSGYPRGLMGNEILIEARVLAVADVIDAIVSLRAYKASRGVGRALAEIENGRDTRYDPMVSDACVKLFREGRFAFDGRHYVAG